MGCIQSTNPVSTQDVAKFLSSSTLSLGLSDTTLRVLAEHCKIHNYKAGETIQSDKLSFIIVMKGEVAVSTLLPKNLESTRQMPENRRPENLVEECICRKRPGDFFCLQAHLSYLTKHPGRRASIKIDLTSMRAMTKNTRLIELPRDEIQRMEKSKPGLTCLLHGLMNFDLTDYLAKIDFFNFNLPQEEKHEWHHVHKVGNFDVLKCFSEICQLKAMKAGTILFHRGDYQRYMYSVLRGEVALYQHGPERAHVNDLQNIDLREKQLDSNMNRGRKNRRVSEMADLVEYMVEGDTFGEAALMINMPSMYAARCSQDSLLCVVDREHFKYIMDAVPTVRDYCFERVRAGCIERLKQYNIPFFAPFIGHDSKIKVEFEHYLKQFELRQYNNTKYVYRQGDLSNELYVVVGGLVQLQYNNKKVANIRSGMSFGDESLFVRNPHRLMSAVVLEPTCVLVGNLDDFHDVFKNDPSVIHEFAIKYLGKDVDLSHVINHPDGREAFRAFLKSEFNDENLMFWEDVRTVRHVQHFKDASPKVWMKRSWQWRNSGKRSGSATSPTTEELKEKETTQDAQNPIDLSDAVPTMATVPLNRIKLTRRGTNTDKIKWPMECTLLEYSETPAYLIDALEICYQHYVKRDGPKAVNISEQMIAEIARQRDEGTWSSETFVKAQEEIYSLMARDVHPRFVNSKLFSNLVQCLGGFPAVVENASQSNVLDSALKSDERNSLRASLVHNKMLTQFKRKDLLYRRFSDLCGPTADEAAKLSQVGLSPSDLKLSTRRSQRGSSMFSAATFSSSRSLQSFKSSVNSYGNVSSVGSLESVKSTGNIFEQEYEEDNVATSTSDIDMVLENMNDITDVTESSESSL